MLTHNICQNAKVALEQVRSLKQAFDDSFSRALTSGQTKDIELAQQYKLEFQKKMAEVRMQIRAWEKKFVQTHEQAISASLSRKKDTGEPLKKFELFVLYECYISLRFSLDRTLTDWRSTRNHEHDLDLMFDEFPNEIARSINEITPETQIYIGKIDEPNFFQCIPDTLELIYTEFPEKRIPRYDIKIGGHDGAELEILLVRNGPRVHPNAKFIMEQEEFQRSLRVPDPAESDWTKWKLKLPEDITLIHLSVSDLGFPIGATTKQIYARAAELGLELCPPEVGIQFRLQYANQPINECVYVGMQHIADTIGYLRIFSVGCDVQPWLSSDIAAPRNGWNEHNQFLFRLRKKAHQNSIENEKS